ncbi:hypothetical protein M9Y10_035685 [Tritrichomonas musculus]|uniref:Adenylate and Guanylate cyclase catalytic domain containing protein n=1 Tax=Tritrichomonas musculus TaxID=1915356 RepID=A0ABR2GWG9_9EUKA
MNAIDASVASQSETSRRSEIKTANGGFASKNFDPFFDFITQFIHPHFLFYLVYIIMISIQIVYVSMWIHSTTFWVFVNDDKKTHSFSDLARIIHYIAPFSPIYKSPKDYLIPFVVFTIIVFIVIIQIIFQILFYKRRRRFSKVILFPTRIMIELVIPIMLIPIAHLTGHSFYYITEKGTTKEPQMYFYFVFGLIEFLICIIIFYYSASIIGVSAYISPSPLSVFDHKPYVYLIMSTSLFTILETCFLRFPAWVIHPLAVLHIVLTVIIAYLLTFQPFTSYKWNCYFLTIVIFSIFLDFLKLVSNFFDFFEIFKDKENGNNTILVINIICFFLLLIASIVISVVYSYLRFKKMKKNLTVNNDNDDDGMPTYSSISEDEKNYIFYKLNLDRSESTALSVLYFVIQNNIVQYLDFSLIKFILNSHKSTKALMQCMRCLSYFPSNSRYLNMLFAIIVKKRDTKFTHHFFIYQIQKIKMFRQSSSSLTACEKLNELIERTKEIEEVVISFWKVNPDSNQKDRLKIVNDHGVDVTYLYQLQDRVGKTRSLWEEALFDFPNSIHYRKEFCHFAIECETKFSEAIKNKHKSDMIESGKNFNVDILFRLFVKTFPNYLKKNILDYKGNFITISKKQSGADSSTSSSSNNSKENSMASFTSMIDGEIEEELGRTLITHSRIRLSLQHATETKKAKRLPSVIFVSIFLFILGLVLAVFIFIYFNNYFNSRSRSMKRIETINKILLYTYTSALLTFYKWGNITDQIHIDEFIRDLEKKDKINESPLLVSDNYDENIVHFNVLSRETFSEYLIDISKLSGEGVDVFKYAATLFEETTPLYYCNATSVIPPIYRNLKTALLFIFMSESLVANLNSSNIHNMLSENIDYCHILSNLMNIYVSFQKTRELLILMDENDSNTDTKSIYKIKLSLSIAYAIITVFLSVIFYFLYIREIMYFVQLLLTLPMEAKINAMAPLKNDGGNKSKSDVNSDEIEFAMNAKGNEPDKKGKISIPLVYCVLIFMCFAVNIVLTYLQLENVQTYNQKYHFLSNWLMNGRYRKVIIVRLTDWIMHLVMADNSLIKGSYFFNKSAFPSLITRNFFELNDNTNKMLEGHDGIPSSNGEDHEIDVLTYMESCETNESDPSYHEMYQCGSLRNILIFFTNGINEMIANAETYNDRIDYRNDEVSAQLLHLVTDHAIPRLNVIDDRWDAVSEGYRQAFKKLHTIFLCCSIIIVLIAFVLMIRLIFILNEAYISCLMLLRRVSPIAIVNDDALVNYLLNRTHAKNESNSSTDQGILKNSQDAIICLSSTGIIEMVNPSVSKIFGFTPEQLLGQPISTSLFDEKSGSTVTNKIFLMTNKQCPLSYEDHVTCITDDNTEIPCQIMILGMTSNNDIDNNNDEIDEAEDDEEKKKKKWEKNSNIESFVVILRDETEMINHQKVAEEAKKQSEQLLYQILPRSIVVRLNQGEKDISFTVPSATIMFIDIAKFSDYASTLTPQEIMGNLSAIMGGYDDAIAKYDMLLKIKLIGDVYMCAGGLFNPDDQPSSHAEQMVRFGLDALQNIEDMNVKLNAVLSVRIGINTGGPLIAGVLGTDKPTFDIIGDPINIASRLQSTDYPGKIQISQETYELVKELDFSIEPRGEVYLKGKGNRPAYIVSQHNGMNFSLSQFGEDSNNSIMKLGSFTG